MHFKHQNTIHNSLEQLDKDYLLNRNFEAPQTQSNIELQKIFPEGKERLQHTGFKNSSDVTMETTKLLDDTDETGTLEALILPQVKGFTKPDTDDSMNVLKPSKSLPDVSNIDSVDYSPHNPATMMKLKEGGRPISHEEMTLIYLLKKKANVKATDYYDSTPLHFAAVRNNVIAAKHLLNTKGIEIEVRLFFLS